MKKILIITYYWAPAGGPGVQRWLKFVKYLRNFGIEPIVYAPKNPHYPMIDSEIGNDIPSDITIIKRSIIEPYAIAALFSKEKTQKISSGIIPTKRMSWLEKCMLWVRGNLFIPDARVLWVRPSILFLEKYIIENQINTIITTAPPHSVHLIGLGLKEKMKNIRWIADFRDPWTNIGYHSSLFLTQKSAQKHLKLEQKVLQTADNIIVTSFSTQKEFQQKTDKPITVITNGYDDYQQVSISLSDKFLLSHIGSLLTERNPKILWQVLGDLVTENYEFANNFQLCLAGRVSDEVLADLNKNGLTPFLDIKGYISHNQVLTLQRQSQVLLLLEINHPNTEGIIPGKLFEYMISGRPILAMGYKNWDAGEIIRQTNTGKVLPYDDYNAIKDCLLVYYDLYKERKLQISHPIGLSIYHRRNLTQKLAEIIKKEV
ncbi:glycosyltransferase [Capnocytophaga catalasegens]|uniref:Glycosyl transferase family 1 n=1 Tax=Capnocytophaga catalasegens TaxID=1004260 RepID=A0AAV5AYM9_9FLAO|nr:glycosyl transferase family 1 [Capnocytophaga catalasegens]GIZ14581.1 glycosyl transferase family 1 [Capnocytophaga catalasegens]GJM50783.1 glycosyl transferase family 1 [Capnocytophaga catalasegens]GJM51936.1 glycosyl transferase family 1 [Capnocytophaga catalasegens]